MRSIAGALSFLLALALGGCANYKVVSSFADQTSQMTGAVSTEFQQIGRMCREQAEMRIAITNATDERLLQACKLQGDALLGFQEVTVDTLELYAKTLSALVEDSKFDLRPSIEATGRKLTALSTPDGSAIVSSAKVGAVTKVLALLADVVAQAKREEGLRRLVDAGPDLVANATILREFFVNPGGTSAYDRWVDVVDTLATSSARQVGPETALARQEPIRSAELRRVIARTRPAIEQRRGTASTVPKQLVVALDAWIVAVQVFQREALRPDPRALLDRIDDLRNKALDARLAVQAGF